MPVSVLAYAVAAFALALSAYAYGTYVHLLGFPDGFVTELAAAERTLAIMFIAMSMAIASVLFWLGTRASRKRSSAAVIAMVVLYGVSVAATAIVDGHLRSTLAGGGGG